MGILDDVVINVKSAAEAVGKKAGQLVDISKLRITVSELNGDINNRLLNLGQYVYDQKKKGEIDETVIADRITEIDELHDQLNVIVQEMGTMQNKVACPVCTKQCPIGASYCSYCGAKLAGE